MQAHSFIADSNIQLQEPIEPLLQNSPFRPGWWISPEATVYEAIEQMSHNHVGALVVLSAQRLDGIISERDYARKVILKGRNSQDTRVHEIMTKAVYSVDLETNIDQCLRLMASHDVNHVPVTQGNKVLGMISMGDLVNWIINSQGNTIHQLKNYISGSYPA